jgi:hypothetical protein
LRAAAAIEISFRLPISVLADGNGLVSHLVVEEESGQGGRHAMQTENRLFDDLARVATGALGALTGVREEIETRIREQLERILDRMNLVRREEFDAVQAMVAKARAAQEALEGRVAQLEARFGSQTGEPPSTTDQGLSSRPATRRSKSPPS